MAMRQKFLILMLALGVAAGFSAEALARAGKGGSFGSRGGFTFNPPAATRTAPGGGSAFQRSWTSPNQGVFRPNAAGNRGGMFGGFGGGLLGGLVGAGLIGMLLGHGFGGGLGGGIMSFIGLLLQLALLFFLVKFVMGFLRRRSLAQQGNAYAAPPPAGAPFGGAAPQQGGFGGFGGMGGFGSAGAGAPQTSKLDVGPTDFSVFEQRLGAIQQAYSNEDANALRAMTTPEMESYFAGELAENARRGVVNRLSDVRFLQGDLSEAWREAGGDYASVAMRFSLNDAMLDRATGALVSGDLSTPQQATEIWTFTRPAGAGPNDWKLSAIQQTQAA